MLVNPVCIVAFSFASVCLRSKDYGINLLWIKIAVSINIDGNVNIILKEVTRKLFNSVARMNCKVSIMNL